MLWLQWIFKFASVLEAQNKTNTAFLRCANYVKIFVLIDNKLLSFSVVFWLTLVMCNLDNH